MVCSLAPKARSRSRFQMRSAAVRTAEMPSCREKQPPSIFSAVCRSPLPMLMDARGAPPEAMSAAKADTIRMIGVQTPRPVRARLPTCGMWPM